MKKWMSLVVSCFFILTSCSPTSPYPTDDTYHFETDSQYTFYTQGGFRNFAETENGYYFSMNINGSCFLFYADKKDMRPIILCNRPNCLHYEEFDVESANYALLLSIRQKEQLLCFIQKAIYILQLQ